MRSVWRAGLAWVFGWLIAMPPATAVQAVGLVEYPLALVIVATSPEQRMPNNVEVRTQYVPLPGTSAAACAQASSTSTIVFDDHGQMLRRSDDEGALARIAWLAGADGDDASRYNPVQIIGRSLAGCRPTAEVLLNGEPFGLRTDSLFAGPSGSDRPAVLGPVPAAAPQDAAYYLIRTADTRDLACHRVRSPLGSTARILSRDNEELLHLRARDGETHVLDRRFLANIASFEVDPARSQDFTLTVTPGCGAVTLYRYEHRTARVTSYSVSGLN